VILTSLERGDVGRLFFGAHTRRDGRNRKEQALVELLTNACGTYSTYIR